MTIEEIKKLKDRVYELEGLLELAQLREDKLSELTPLIEARLKALTDDDESSEVSEVTDEVQEAPVESISELFEETDTVSITPSEPETKIEVTTEMVSPDKPAMEKVATEKVATEKAQPEKEMASGRKPAFCLNDRFRFRRELFGNSDARFAEAMNAVAMMDSYAEAEEYFLGDLAWDPENPEVVDFLDIIRKYFES